MTAELVPFYPAAPSAVIDRRYKGKTHFPEMSACKLGK
jgi:hypothetical protein